MYECNLILDGYRNRQKEEWARVQRVAWLIAQVNSKSKVDPDDVVNLNVFDPDWEPETPAGETPEQAAETRERVRQRQSAIARMLAAQTREDQGPGEQ